MGKRTTTLIRPRSVMPQGITLTYIPYEKMPLTLNNVVGYHLGEGAFSARTDDGVSKKHYIFILRPGDFVDVDVTHAPTA